MPPSGRRRHRDRDPDRHRSPNNDPQSSPIDPSFDPTELFTMLENASEACSKIPTPAEVGFPRLFHVNFVPRAQTFHDLIVAPCRLPS
jgi:hypothetical protein